MPHTPDPQPTRPTPEPEDAAEIIRRTIRYTGLSIAAGGISGVILAAWRSQPVAFYAGTMGLNYGLFGGTYFTLRELLRLWLPHDTNDRLTSAMAGSMAGGLMTTVHAGTGKGLQGALFWGIVGYAAQLTVDNIGQEKARLRAKLEHQRAGVLPSAEPMPGLSPAGQRQLGLAAPVPAVHRTEQPMPSPSPAERLVALPFTAYPGRGASMADSTWAQLQEMDKTRAARAAWLRYNAAALRRHGLNTAPFETEIHAEGATPDAARKLPGQEVVFRDRQLAQLLAADPVLARDAPGATSVWEAHRQLQLAYHRSQRAGAGSGAAAAAADPVAALTAMATQAGSSGDASTDSASWGATATQAADALVGLGASPQELAQRVRVKYGWMPAWLPFKAYDEAAIEARTIARLNAIETQLARDDEYRRIQDAKTRAYDHMAAAAAGQARRGTARSKPVMTARQQRAAEVLAAAAAELGVPTPLYPRE